MAFERRALRGAFLITGDGFIYSFGILQNDYYIIRYIYQKFAKVVDKIISI